MKVARRYTRGPNGRTGKTWGERPPKIGLLRDPLLTTGAKSRFSLSWTGKLGRVRHGYYAYQLSRLSWHKTGAKRA
jgi:hypothetical protein